MVITITKLRVYVISSSVSGTSLNLIIFFCYFVLLKIRIRQTFLSKNRNLMVITITKLRGYVISGFQYRPLSLFLSKIRIRRTSASGTSLNLIIVFVIFVKKQESDGYHHNKAKRMSYFWFPISTPFSIFAVNQDKTNVFCQKTGI